MIPERLNRILSLLEKATLEGRVCWIETPAKSGVVVARLGDYSLSLGFCANEALVDEDENSRGYTCDYIEIILADDHGAAIDSLEVNKLPSHIPLYHPGNEDYVREDNLYQEALRQARSDDIKKADEAWGKIERDLGADGEIL